MKTLTLEIRDAKKEKLIKEFAAKNGIEIIPLDSIIPFAEDILLGKTFANVVSKEAGKKKVKLTKEEKEIIEDAGMGVLMEEVDFTKHVPMSKIFKKLGH